MVRQLCFNKNIIVANMDYTLGCNVPRLWCPDSFVGRGGRFTELCQYDQSPNIW